MNVLQTTSEDLNMLDNSSKICCLCKKSKFTFDFHKNKLMPSGFLNECKECTYEKKKAYRKNNPEKRKEEYQRLSKRLGRMTWQEYQQKRRDNAKGRKVISAQYAHRRRLLVDDSKMSEIDLLTFCEAVHLRELRKKFTKIDWHVDHIVPINHKKACGLHNAFNLQVVPAKWNLTKRHSNMDVFWGV
jgi:hypothetical protein